MNFDKKPPNHFFFKDWELPKEIKELHPFISQRGGVNKDTIFNVTELDYGDFKIQICINDNNCWIKKC